MIIKKPLIIEVLLLDDQPIDSAASIAFLEIFMPPKEVIFRAITKIPDNLEDLLECDGIIADFHLRQKFSGLEVAAALHKLDPDLPICVLTASQEDYELLREWRETGARWLWDKWELPNKASETIEFLNAMKLYHPMRAEKKRIRELTQSILDARPAPVVIEMTKEPDEVKPKPVLVDIPTLELPSENSDE